MNYKDSFYYNVGKATDLRGGDYFLYRTLEIIPGLLAWLTIILIFVCSFIFPFYCSIFIIIFDVYWILKTFYLSIYLRQNWKKAKHNLEINWKEKLIDIKYDKIYHLILLPFYNESWEIVEKSLLSLSKCEYDNKKMIIVLAGEESTKEHCIKIIEQANKKFSHVFGELYSTIHPNNIIGEIRGKGSNIAYAVEEARKNVLDKKGLPYEDILVSAFDIDTVVYPQYFECLTWNFLTTEDRMKCSFQPIPVFTNNIWEAPALSRVVSFSATFWQMIQQERPDILATFSSHSVCFKTLYEVGYWQKNIVSEDSRIFWNSLLASNGNYRVVPLAYPVSMDANLAESFWQTIKNIYKQQRRWAWGVENGPYVVFGFLKNKNIPTRLKLKFTFFMYEGFWSLSTNPLIIFFLGWLPIILGGRDFNSTVLSYNLPFVTKILMTISMLGLFMCLLISASFLPKAPKWTGYSHKIIMVIQWLLIPFTIIIFGAVPGLDAQTRLMLGRYMGFWVTPKHRKND